MGQSLQQFADELAKWSDATFGPARKPDATIAHLQNEVEELKNAPYDRGEYADCFILLLGSWRLAFHEPVEGLIDSAKAKFEINKKREWGKPNAQGFTEHVKKNEGSTT